MFRSLILVSACAGAAAGPARAGDAQEYLEAKLKYQEVEVAAAGVVSGVVQWAGDLPELARFPIHKNVEVCAQHQDAEARRSPRLLIDPDSRGVRNTVVFLADVTAGKPMSTLVTPVLDQVACEFVPHVLLIQAGKKLEMKSSDDILHNVHAVGTSQFNKPFPLAGVVISQRLRKPGICELSCDAGHSWMSGYVFAVQHPYFAVTDEQGRYRLEDVPAGKYRLFAWHEGWNVVQTDKDPEGVITHYAFDEPHEWHAALEVAADGEHVVDLKLSAQGLAPAAGT